MTTIWNILTTTPHNAVELIALIACWLAALVVLGVAAALICNNLQLFWGLMVVGYVGYAALDFRKEDLPALYIFMGMVAVVFAAAFLGRWLNGPPKRNTGHR